MQLFYNPEIKDTDKEIIFPKDESRHIVKVLRKSEGDSVNVTNGKGALFHAEIVTASTKSCVARIVDVKKENAPEYYLHMAVAPTKMNDRYEWFLEKATEIGVHEITPVICDHSERKMVKLERFERVLQSAMKQSLHFSIPKLNEPMSLSDFVNQKIEGQKFIAHCEEGQEKQLLKELLQKGQRVTILIGPEGDFSNEEIKMALQQDWWPVSLGKSRLRTETAAIVACNTVSLANED